MDHGIITPEYYIENYKQDKSTKKKKSKICEKCNVVMDNSKRIVHCEECNICIMGYDHHCPWSSKCIGKNNLSMFNKFIFGLFLQIGYLTVSALITAIFADFDKYKKKNKL